MIKSVAYSKTIDGEKCMNLAREMNDDPVRFMKKHRLPLNSYRTVEDCLRELWNDGNTKTFMSDVAEVFKKYGFEVNMDNNSINYEIS